MPRCQCETGASVKPTQGLNLGANFKFNYRPGRPGTVTGTVTGSGLPMAVNFKVKLSWLRDTAGCHAGGLRTQLRRGARFQCQCSLGRLAGDSAAKSASDSDSSISDTDFWGIFTLECIDHDCQVTFGNSTGGISGHT